jgi:hypothetical protein
MGFQLADFRECRYWCHVTASHPISCHSAISTRPQLLAERTVQESTTNVRSFIDGQKNTVFYLLHSLIKAQAVISYEVLPDIVKVGQMKSR